MNNNDIFFYIKDYNEQVINECLLHNITNFVITNKDKHLFNKLNYNYVLKTNIDIISYNKLNNKKFKKLQSEKFILIKQNNLIYKTAYLKNHKIVIEDINKIRWVSKWLTKINISNQETGYSYYNKNILVGDFKKKISIRRKDPINRVFEKNIINHLSKHQFLDYVVSYKIKSTHSSFITKFDYDLKTLSNVKINEIIVTNLLKEIKKLHEIPIKKEFKVFEAFKMFSKQDLENKNLDLGNVISHNDLSPHNVLFDTVTNNIKFIDFEFCCLNIKYFDYIQLIISFELSWFWIDFIYKYLNFNDEEINFCNSLLILTLNQWINYANMNISKNIRYNNIITNYKNLKFYYLERENYE